MYLQVVQSLLQQLWPEYLSNNNTMQWNPQQNHPIFGSATFDPEGLLIGQEELLAADDEATKGLVQDLISGQQPQSNKQHRALLPVFQQGCKLQVTSCQNIVVLKSSRTGMLLLPYGAKMLLEVVNACKQQQQLRAGYLDRDAAKSIQVGKEVDSMTCLVRKMIHHGGCNHNLHKTKRVFIKQLVDLVYCFCCICHFHAGAVSRCAYPLPG